MSVIRKTPGVPALETVLEQWRAFCEKPPKGFEKFFEPAGKRKPNESKEAKKESSSKDAPSKKPPSGEVPRPPSIGSGPRSSDSNWSFGMFSGGSG